MQTHIVALCFVKILLVQMMVSSGDHSHQHGRANADWRFLDADYLPYEDFFTEPTLPLAYRNLNHYTSTLDLTPEQRDFIRNRYRALITGYMEQWVDIAERRADARFLDAQHNDDDYEARLRRFHAEEQRLVQEIRGTLLEDLQLILTPEQRDRWSIAEREFERRETLANYAIFDEERIDLIEIVEELDLSDEDRKKLADTLEEYAQAVGPLIKMRNARIEAAASKYAELLNERERFNRDYAQLTENDQERASQLAGEYIQRRQKLSESITTEGVAARRASERIRDANIRFRDDLLRILPEHTHDAFTKHPRPQPNRSIIDFSHSRAEQLLSVLRNVETATVMLESTISMYAMDYYSDHGEITELREWLQLVRSAEPINRDQRRQLRRIEDRLQERRDAVLARHPALRKRIVGEPNPDITFNIPTPHGKLIFRRDGNTNPLTDQDRARIQEIRAELNRIDQDAVDEIRAILTIRQRMAVSSF